LVSGVDIGFCVALGGGWLVRFHTKIAQLVGVWLSPDILTYRHVRIRARHKPISISILWSIIQFI